MDVAVGRKLRLWRIARGLSQSQLAKRLGVTFQQVQKYEIGGNRISMGRLVKAASILGVPIGAFLHGTAEPSESLTGLISSSGAFHLARAFATIRNKRFRESLVALVEKLAAVPQKPKRPRR